MLTESPLCDPTAPLDREIPGPGQLHRILINKNLEELRREPLLVDLRRRIRDVKQGRDGLLYLLTDEADAVMLRIEPAE